MGVVTYFVIQPFELSKKGRLFAGTAVPAQHRDTAIRAAERVAREKAGAIAFSRTGDPEMGEFDDAVILASFGSVPDDLASL
jgi:hypothetical protein